MLVGLAPGSSESYDAWLDFFRDLEARGLKPPLLGITDGAPGMLRAFEEVFDKSLRQRCLVHKARNVTSKGPQGGPGRGQGRVLVDLRLNRNKTPGKPRSRRPRRVRSTSNTPTPSSTRARSSA